jgi:hypothetical protein
VFYAKPLKNCHFYTHAGLGVPRKYFPKKEKYNCKNLDKRINSEGKL